MTRRLLVTGGTGYLGRVVAELAAPTWEVTAPGSAGVDVRDADAVLALVHEVAPDAIVHTAYVRDGPTAAAVIVDGTANVARAAATTGARLVHVSSDVVFDGLAGRPYREDDAVSPVNDYGRAKVAAEQALARLAPGAVTVRTSLIYGGPQRPPSPHELAAVDPDATFYVDELRCPVQVDDLAAALLELCDAAVDGVLHVAGADGLSRHRFAELIAGRPRRGSPAPPGRPLDCRLDTARAADVLTVRARGVTEVYPPR